MFGIARCGGSSESSVHNLRYRKIDKKLVKTLYFIGVETFQRKV